MPFFEYLALEPLVNRAMLDSGPGAVPLENAARAYSAADEALQSAATGTDGHLKSMKDVWPGGLSSQRAQSAFAKHNHWVRDQAANSGSFGRLAERGVGLHNEALGSMPSRAEIEAAIAALEASAAAMTASSTVAASGVPGVAAAGAVAFAGATAWHAAAEMEYHRLRLQAGLTMMRYEAGALGLAGDLLAAAGALTPAPPIVAGGPGSPPPPSYDAVGPLQNLIANGPDSPHYPGNSASNAPSNGGGSESGGNSNPGGEGPDSGPGGEGPGPDPGPTGPEQPLADPQQPLASQQGFDAGPGGYGPESSNSSPLLGVSSESSTLAALNGGAVGLAGFGMMRGGIGSMPGAATGFRLPGGWNPAAGTAFGASNPTVAPTATARGAARRVSAPAAQMRRRRRDEETREGKVFTPGEQFEVPELERPPVIGVIEYQDDDLDNDLLVDSSLVGVLDRLDDADEPENGYSTR
ncbi:PPE domain-containing protein [Nocardia sp. NPDC019395]|uniref:PPE domain-containing protein n=1 Tax=Nocardia sp. NPDC019395 TaxID=3154686 RepID=UPI0033DECF79